MKPEIENLKVWMSGGSTTGYQRALAMKEFEQLLSYVTELEQLRQPLVRESLLSCKKCGGYFGVNINHRCFKCLEKLF